MSTLVVFIKEVQCDKILIDTKFFRLALPDGN